MVNEKKRYNVWMENKTDTFVILIRNSKPDLVNVDADKVLLWDKTDNKTSEDFVFQYKHATNYLDRREALDFFNNKSMDELSLGLNDKYAGLRRQPLSMLSKSKFGTDVKVIATLHLLPVLDKDKKTKAAALKFLAATKDSQISTTI